MTATLGAISKMIRELEQTEAEYLAKFEAASSPTLRDMYSNIRTGIGICIQQAIRLASEVKAAEDRRASKQVQVA